jgi:hypothetical protein
MAVRGLSCGGRWENRNPAHGGKGRLRPYRLPQWPAFSVFLFYKKTGKKSIPSRFLRLRDNRQKIL